MSLIYLRAARVPFLLDGFAADPRLFQADGLHPTVAVHGRMIDNVWPTLRPFVGGLGSDHG